MGTRMCLKAFSSSRGSSCRDTSWPHTSTVSLPIPSNMMTPGDGGWQLLFSFMMRLTFRCESSDLDLCVSCNKTRSAVSMRIPSSLCPWSKSSQDRRMKPTFRLSWTLNRRLLSAIAVILQLP